MKRLVGVISILFVLLFIIGCNSDFNNSSKDNNTNELELNENKVNETKIKEAKYGEALVGLAASDSIELDKRFDQLNKQIQKILEGEEELDLATFTRIKIELDFLSMEYSNKKKLNKLQLDFKKAFSEAEKIANEDSITGSLNDRYYSINSKVDMISSKEEKLKMTDYLKIENGITALVKDDYLANRITDLRSKLLKIVVAQLESAVLNFEVPEIDEETLEQEIIKKEELEKEQIDADKLETPDDKIEVYETLEEGIKIVKLVNGGFNTAAITINVNDTVVWQNDRTGSYKMALILGNRECRDVKSGIYYSGESYNFTFTEPGTCWISDGIYTTQAMRVIVS